MANLKASQKDIQRSRRNAERNRRVRSRLRTLRRKFDSTLAGGDASAKVEAGRSLVSAYDHAVKTNVVHPNRAADIKSKVSKVFAETSA
jgi:small subunit ribosomal protein S20